MRQYGFRGKSEAGEWHYGLLAQSAGFPGQPRAGMYISNSVGAPYAYRVIPESVGQYIEKSDKNGNEIYEGDILKSMRTDLLYEVVFNGRYAGKAIGNTMTYLHDLHKLDMRFYEVVSNILEVVDNGL